MGIPHGWKLVKFGEICVIANGQVSPTVAPYSSYLHIGPENIEGGCGRLSVLQTANQLGLKSGKYLFDEKSIVYSKIRPNLNKVCRPDFVGVCSADAYPIWPKKGVVEKDFLYYLILNADFVKQATELSARTGLPKINRRDLALVRVCLPPLREQLVISRNIDEWAKAIEIQKLLIKKKQMFKLCLMKQLLSGSCRFPKFVRTHGTRSTRFGFYPVDWEYPCVGQIAKEVSERSRSENRYTVLSCSKHQGLVDSLEYFGKRVFSSDTSNYKVVRRGQFAYATNHIEEGSIGLLTTHEAGLISPIYTVFETDARKVNAPFLFRLFKTELYRHIFEVNTSSSVDRRGSLRWTQFATIHVPLPTLGEQRRIVEVLDTVDREIDLLTRQADALTRQKKALMQKLLTGQIRVKV